MTILFKCPGIKFVELIVDTNAFSFENAYFSMRFRLSSTLKRSKTHTFENAVQSGHGGDILKRNPVV